MPLNSGFFGYFKNVTSKRIWSLWMLPFHDFMTSFLMQKIRKKLQMSLDSAFFLEILVMRLHKDFVLFECCHFNSWHHFLCKNNKKKGYKCLWIRVFFGHFRNATSKRIWSLWMLPFHNFMTSFLMQKITLNSVFFGTF